MVLNEPRLTKLLLYVIGAALFIGGFLGLMIDFLPDLNIKPENSSILVLLLGLVILVIASILYTIIPQYQEQRRLEQLRRYYIGKPEGEAKNIMHNIIEKTQSIMGGVDLLSEDIRECVTDNMNYETCDAKIAMAKDLLTHINSESNKLNDYLKQLEDYMATKKRQSEKSK